MILYATLLRKNSCPAYLTILTQGGLVSLREQCRLGAADQRLYCYLLSCCVMFLGALGSKVGALAHRAVPAIIEYHVIQPTWLQLETDKP